MSRKSEAGFTLLELIFVTAVIGLLSAMAVPTVFRSRMAANETSAFGTIRTVHTAELTYALKLLRTRHMVLVASLRERVIGELIAQPLNRGDAAIEVASAHMYAQARRDAFHRLAARDAMMVDAEPERLGVDLVNRYHAVKRAGLI